MPKFSKANLSSLRACMLACRSSKRLLLGYHNRSGGRIGQPRYHFQRVSLEFTMHARCKRFRTREGESVPVENVIAETLAKSPPSFRVLIIYCGRRWGEGEREEREGLYFISFCRGSGRGRREEGNLGDLAVRLSLSVPRVQFHFLSALGRLCFKFWADRCTDRSSEGERGRGMIV